MVLLAHRGGEGLRHPLPAPRPRPRGAAAGGRAGRGGADPARRERARRGHGLLRRRECRGEPRPPLAGLFDRSPRQREVRAAVPAARRRHRRRPRVGARDRIWPGLVRRRRLHLLRPHGRGAAALPALAPPARHRSGRRRPRLRGAGPALLPRDRLHPGHRLRAHRPAQHQHHRMARHPLGRPAGRAPRRPAPPGGRGVRRRPPHARLGRHRLVHRPDQRGGPGLPGARRPGPGRPGCGDRGDRLSGGDPAPARHPDRGRRCLRPRPRPERARRGPAPGTRPPPPRPGRPLRGRPAPVELGRPVDREPLVDLARRQPRARRARRCASAARRS